MLATRADDLPKLLAEVGRQTAQVDQIFRDHSTEQLRWRPDQKGWSVMGHVAHMSIINVPYLDAIEERVGRESGSTSAGPWSHPWFSRYFATSMEPPVTRRFKTMKSMVPDLGSDPETELATFKAAQTKMTSVIEACRGVDLGRVRFASPFFRLFRFSIGGGLGLLLAHNRRHIWLAEEVMAHASFPRD
ncbi:MAG: DinB family protein [Gemmatimonadota bacterium]